EVVRDLLAMRSTPVWIVSWIWSGFFFAAILLVSAIPDMQHELGVSMSDSSLLLGAAGLGIGIGCAIAGWCSGAAIRNTFVCPGGGALVCVYLLMAILPPSWWLVFVLLMLLGIASGFYLVPLLAMMQRLAPPEERGRWLAASNWLCYVMMSLAGLFYALTASYLGVKGIFLACSGVMLFIVVVLLAIPHALKFDEAEYA
ncbi:MAG: MFS transporter, partial [Phycisphaerales bacterium]|nr:MFS transporter [Phycisphaerales bacterium]